MGLKIKGIMSQKKGEKTCGKCGSAMKRHKGKTLDGVEYIYFKCHECGEKLVDIGQLREFVQNYRTMKSYNVKVSKWGRSLGIRIPKEIASKHGLGDGMEVRVLPEDNGFRIIAEKPTEE